MVLSYILAEHESDSLIWTLFPIVLLSSADANIWLVNIRKNKSDMSAFVQERIRFVHYCIKFNLISKHAVLSLLNEP